MTEQITLFGERTALPSPLPPAPPPSPAQAIEGVVSRQLAERGDWRLLLVEVDGAQQKWSGEMHRPPDGTTVRATGRFEQDRRGPGQILRVDSLLDVVPTHELGLIDFIAQLGVPGVKKGLAKKIVKRFGLETVAILDASPERIAEVLGKKGEKKAADIAAEWAKKRALAATTMFLLEKGATPGMARKIVNRFEERARWIVENDPYRLTEIDGIGFAKADDLAVKIGLPRDSIQRAQAAILHSLVVETYERGHTYTPVEDLARAATELIEVASHRIDEAMADLHAAGTRVVFTETEGGRVASMPRIARAEARLVRRLNALISATPKTWPAPALTGGVSKPLPELVEQAIAGVEQSTKMTLAAAQREAVTLAAQHNVIVMTGGPGVGKSMVANAILELFKLGNIPTVLCAPTGRAAKRMNEATGASAATIHRTLSYDPQTKGFLHNEERPIHCGAVIVDEVSMLELSLAGDIFGAIPDGARVVIVGDVDQLPSVGPGAVLRDLIESGRIPTVRLTQIFRQAKGSEISVQAQRVNAGQMPQGQPGPEGEFFVIRRDDGESAAEAVLDMVTKRIPERFGIAPKDVFVLAPMYRGRAGIDALNRMLQDALNPLDAVNGVQVVRGKEPDVTRFRVGDRVLQTKNNAECDVFNGDLGIITSITVEHDEKGKPRNVVNVVFDGGRAVAYPEGKPLDAITLAYAMSVHRSQGSTLPAVVVVMLTEHYVMLSREIVYTAITRARHLAVLVSSPKAMGKAVSEAGREERRTLLAEKMRRMCDA